MENNTDQELDTRTSRVWPRTRFPATSYRTHEGNTHETDWQRGDSDCRIHETIVYQRNLNVLVADDRTDVRIALDSMLRHLGVKQLRLAIDGIELLRLARDNAPDLVISDVNMPSLDGLAAMDQLPHMPCIMISGIPICKAWCDRNAHRLVACLSKPFRVVDIQKALADFVVRFDSKRLTS